MIEAFDNSFDEFDLEEDTIDPEDIAYAAYQAGLEHRAQAIQDHLARQIILERRFQAIQDQGIDYEVEIAVTKQLLAQFNSLKAQVDECLLVIRSLMDGAKS